MRLSVLLLSVPALASSTASLAAQSTVAPPTAASAGPPETLDLVVEAAYVKAFNTDPEDQFGESVAIDGSWMVVGAPYEDSAAVGVNGDDGDNTATDAGAAYVFRRTGTDWSQEAYLRASNTLLGQRFGGDVRISGDRCAVGARQDSSTATGVNGDAFDTGGFSTGAVHTFVRSGGVWAPDAYIKASNTGSGDHFGEQLHLDGTNLLTGGHLEVRASEDVGGDGSDDSAHGAGVAYAYAVSDFFLATEVSRTGTPPNPDVLRPGLTSRPLLGATWYPWIDHTGFYPTVSFDAILITSRGTANVPLPFGTLLCDLSAPPDAQVTVAAGQVFAFQIPLDQALLGLPVYVQGASAGDSGLALTNALDVVLGNL